MKADLDRIKMENQYLRTELRHADRAKSLAIFQTTVAIEDHRRAHHRQHHRRTARKW